MANYSVLSDVSATLLAMLRECLCPDPIPSREAVMLAAPNDKNGDYQLGVYLYELRDLNEYRSSAASVSLTGVRIAPPRPYTMRYMLFVNNKAQMAAGAELEQRILGRAIQALLDNGELNLSARNPEIGEEEQTCAVSLLNQSFEDKGKIWAALSAPYQLSICIEVSPVLISPRGQQSVARVVSAQVALDQRRGQPR